MDEHNTQPEHQAGEDSERMIGATAAITTSPSSAGVGEGNGAVEATPDTPPVAHDPPAAPPVAPPASDAVAHDPPPAPVAAAPASDAVAHDPPPAPVAAAPASDPVAHDPPPAPVAAAPASDPVAHNPPAAPPAPPASAPVAHEPPAAPVAAAPASDAIAHDPPAAPPAPPASAPAAPERRAVSAPAAPASGPAAQDRHAAQGGREPALNAENDMAALLAASDEQFRQLKYGDVIEGTIMRKDADEILVDIGFKSEGIIPSNELQSLTATELANLSIGDEVLVSVLQPEDKEGHVVLSLDRARQEKSWRKLQKQFEGNEIIEAEVNGYNKGGLLVNLEGVRGFVPASQVTRLSSGGTDAPSRASSRASPARSCRSRLSKLTATATGSSCRSGRRPRNSATPVKSNCWPSCSRARSAKAMCRASATSAPLSTSAAPTASSTCRS